MMVDLSALLTSPSGVFFYQLTIMLVILGGLIVTLGRNPGRISPIANRLITGFGALLILRLSLSGAAIAVLAFNLDPGYLLGLERGFATAGLILALWLWAFPQRSAHADTGAAILTILVILMTFLSAVLIYRTGGPAAAPAWISFAWMIFSILMIVAGIFLLIRTKPPLWGYGLSMGVILFAAEVAVALAGSPDPATGILRLAQIAAFPILLTLPQRIGLPAEPPPAQQLASRSGPERKRVNLPPNVYGKFLALATETDLLALCRGITETVSFALVADICLIISRPTDQDEIIIYCGYDQVLEQEIGGAQIAARHLPMIVSAIQKHAALRLPASSASSDLKYLSDALRLPKSGHLLVAPIRTISNTGVGALLLLTPYSSRNWTQDDQTYLSLAAQKVAAVLDQSQILLGLHAEIESLRARLAGSEGAEPRAASARDLLSQTLTPEGTEQRELYAALEEAALRHQNLEGEIEILQDSNRKLLTNLEDQNWNQTIQHLQAENIQLQLGVHELETSNDEVNARAERTQEAQRETLLLVERLNQQNEALRRELETAGADHGLGAVNGRPAAAAAPGHTENELKESLREIAHLRNLVGESEIKILELENLASANANTTRQWETIITLAEEMRQPMSSILGYSDFLLNESVGLLGNLQRKFLERVKASTNRMSAMVEDLIHVAASESGKLKLNISEFELAGVIDSAIAATTVQIREKSISLLTNLPEDLPNIEGDREAIRLTLIHLLHNAAAASPASGEISIEIKQTVNGGVERYLQIAVSDSGGGIAQEDLAKVFERRFQSHDELIGGLGVSSSGLSVAKTLVEAHGGRIWVENRDQAGASFFILIPLRQDMSETIFGKRSF